MSSSPSSFANDSSSFDSPWVSLLRLESPNSSPLSLNRKQIGNANVNNWGVFYNAKNTEFKSCSVRPSSSENLPLLNKLPSLLRLRRTAVIVRIWVNRVVVIGGSLEFLRSLDKLSLLLKAKA